jgi:hypothetical protein
LYPVADQGNTLLTKSTMQKTSAFGMVWFFGPRTEYQA